MENSQDLSEERMLKGKRRREEHPIILPCSGDQVNEKDGENLTKRSIAQRARRERDKEVANLNREKKHVFALRARRKRKMNRPTFGTSLPFELNIPISKQEHTTPGAQPMLETPNSSHERLTLLPSSDSKVEEEMKSPAVEEVTNAVFPNDDIEIEILSRLPTESIVESKCVCKRWLGLFSHPSFSSAHFQRCPRQISGLFVQGIRYCLCCQHYLDFKVVDFVSIGKPERHQVSQTVLEFLPERVSVVTACNGILLCRNIFEETYESHFYDRQMGKIKDDPKEVVLYVCNPLTEEWITFKPEGKYENGCCFGFAYNPLGTSLVNPTQTFAVVMVQPPSQLGKTHLFHIYSSETGTWRISNDICNLPNRLHLHQTCFTNGVFYWLTTGHSILTFDLERERSQVIQLPGVVLDREGDIGMCLGVSEGTMHYICFNTNQLMVWVLKHDISAPKWLLKHSKPILEMYHPILDKWYRCSYWATGGHKKPNGFMHPFAFQDDILFMQIFWSMCTYNIKTGMIEEELCSFSKLDNSANETPIVIPYSKSLLPVQAIKNQDSTVLK